MTWLRIIVLMVASWREDRIAHRHGTQREWRDPVDRAVRVIDAERLR
jgi:hypothetical protein